MSSFNLDKAAELAGLWWARRFIDPKFDNGMNDKQGRFSSALASYFVQSVTEESINKVCDGIVNAVKKALKDSNSVTLESDYHPEGLLSEIITECDFPAENVPWKTYMSIRFSHKENEENRYKIYVKEGYGNPITELGGVL